MLEVQAMPLPQENAFEFKLISAWCPSKELKWISLALSIPEAALVWLHLQSCGLGLFQ